MDIATSSTAAGDEPESRRENLRAPLGIGGRLVLLGGVGRCAVENISREGACILTRLPIKVGESGVLQRDGFDRFFTVQWEKNGRCGLSFDEIVPKDIILKLRKIAESSDKEVDEAAWEFGREWVEGSAGHSVD